MTSIINEPPQRPAFRFTESSQTLTPALEKTYAQDIESQYIQKDYSEKKAQFILDESHLEFPEGGLKAYLVVFGAFMGLTACFGLLNIPGAIESYVKEHQLANCSSSAVGWIFSISSFLTYTSCIFSGTYFDRNGCRTMMMVGTVMVCGGILATSKCQTLWQFILAFSFVTSLGNGLLMSPLVSVISHYFSRRRAFFCSIATVGGSVGGVVYPLMLRSLYEKIGFEWAIRVLALCFFFGLSFSIVLCQERIHADIKPEKTIKEKVKIYLALSDFKALKEKKFLLCVLGAVLAEIATVNCLTYFASYAIAQGFTMNDSYLLITLVSAGSIPGRLVTGYLADIVGRFNVMIITITLTSVVNLVIWLPFGASLKVLYAYSIIYGVFSGSIFSLLPVCCGQICKTEDFGKRYSIMYFLVAFGVLVGVPIGGAIISNGAIVNYNWFIVYTSIVSLLSAMFYAFSRYCCIGFKILAKF